MRFGVMVPHWGESSSPQAILAVAQEAEALGFHSLWLGDHVSVPVSDQTAARDRFFEAVTTLGYLIGVTQRIQLATGVLIVPYRQPLITASALATAHHLSGGRIIFGGAAGWMKPEFKALNVPFEGRGARTDEYLDVIRHLWTTPRPHTFHGRHVDFKGLKFSPEIHPAPPPPIWIGGNSRAAAQRAVARGDAWFPLHLSLDRLKRRALHLRELAAANGRTRPLTLAMGSSVDFQPTPGAAPKGIEGSPQQVIDAIGAYRDAGLQYLVLDFPRASLDLLLASLRTFAERVAPVFASGF